MDYTVPQKITVIVNALFTLLFVGLALSRLRRATEFKVGGRIGILALSFFGIGALGSLGVAIALLTENSGKNLPMASLLFSGFALVLHHMTMRHFIVPNFQKEEMPESRDSDVPNRE
jgi:hypothetical protein